MPQAVKHFTGTANGQASATVYTCPASTIAIVIPTISVNAGSNDYITFGWNSSSAATQYGGNLSFYAYNDSNDQAHVSAIDKYNVLVTIPEDNNASAITYFSASYTGNLAGNNAVEFENGASADTNPITPTGGGRLGSTYTPAVHSTGPWVMSAGHVLSYYVDSGSYISYNFLILEEAA